MCGVAPQVQTIHLPWVPYGYTSPYLVPRDQCEVTESLKEIAGPHGEMMHFDTMLPVNL